MQVTTKYKAKPVTIDGIRFASQAEGRRYGVLKLLERAGQITDLELQPVFVLAAGVKVPGELRKRPALRYVADFAYTDRYGLRVVEDCKGVETPVFRIKRHLLALQGIKVDVVK
jgi:hypothetical protein